MVSKTQIDRLGDRLRQGNINEADLRMLDEYRRSFSEAYDFVVIAIREELELEPTGRPAKSTTSISEKLNRESIRLTQVQDIAGCRLIATEIIDQERVINSLKRRFADLTIVDRRKQPSHGYRAVHLIVRHRGKLVEIQVRTSLQHAWAEFSEKFADLVDPAIKYGAGDPKDQELLIEYSGVIAELESVESELLMVRDDLSALFTEDNLTEEEQDAIVRSRKKAEKLQRELPVIRQRLLGKILNAIDKLPERKI